MVQEKADGKTPIRLAGDSGDRKETGAVYILGEVTGFVNWTLRGKAEGV